MKKDKLPVLTKKVSSSESDRAAFMRIYRTQLDNDKLWSFNRTPRTLKEAFGG